MLLDRNRELLTAYVDGELTGRQRRHVARLLRRSAEARQLLQQLQEDARSLRHLPPPHLAIDLAGEVLRTIVERRLMPGQRRAAKLRVSTSWVGPLAAWATAAAVLLVLGAASYLYFAASLAHSLKSDLVQKEPNAVPPALVPEKPAPSAVAKGQAPPAPSNQRPSPKPDKPSVGQAPEIVKLPLEAPSKPSVEVNPAPSKDETVLTDRLEMFRLTEVQAALPVVLKVRELDREPVRKDLIGALRKDANFRLELPCQNGTKAFEHVQTVAKAMNLGLVIEKRAQDRLKMPKWKTNYVVYMENLTPEELAQFLQRIGVEDKKKAAHKPAEGQFDRLVLTRMTPEHHKELSTLMGVDPTASEPAPKGPLGTDLHKPLSDLTALQVGQTLAGQGGTPRPEAGKPAAKPPAHLALVLAYNPVRPYPGSVEIKRFLESRKSAKPGTLRVLLVLRG
jgi:hypothetical protein